MTSPAKEQPDLAALEAGIDAEWPRALARWSSFLLLRRPVVSLTQEAIAQIDLRTRQVSVNGPQIVEHGLLPALEAILAHEVGHHVRHPGSLAVEARLRTMERALLPESHSQRSFLNLFEDFLINAHLGRELSASLAAVYRAFESPEDPRQRPHAVFLLYLAAYEDLWSLGRGALIGRHEVALRRRHPGFEDDARALARNLIPLGPNPYTQLGYFLSIIIPYLDDPEQALPEHSCELGEPSAEDWAQALEPSAQVREAVERAEREGWINAAQAQRARGQAFDRLEGETTARRSEILAAYYRRLTDRYLIEPPREPGRGDGLLPSTLEDWESGEPLRSIDWVATARSRGDQLGGAAPLRRTQLADLEGLELPGWRVKLEIYLDVSSSMPDPSRALNAMTLAAQILAAGAIRAGGAVRALLYSDGCVRHWSWTRSEREISRFLLGYLGAGTRYPFEVLAASIRECRHEQPLRVVISDSDFDANFVADRATAVLRDAGRPPGMVLLLHRRAHAADDAYRALGARVALVPNLTDFPEMAASLTRELFPAERSHDAQD